MDILGIVDINGWIITLFSLCLTAFLYSRSKHQVWKRNGVPGPEPTPFVGVTFMYNKQGMAKTDQELVRKYGRFVGMYQGHRPTLLISDPETIKFIMVKDFATFPNRINILLTRNEFKHALNNVEDDHWRFMRNTLLPTFSSGKMRMMNPLFKRHYERLLEILKPKAEAGIPIEFKEVYAAYTMDVIAATGFGLDIDSQRNPENNFTKYAKILFSFSFSPLVILQLIFPSSHVILDWLKISPNNNRTVMDFFKSVVTRAIEIRDENDQKRKDLLQLMINAHNDTDVNEDESQHDYQNDPNIWKKRVTWWRPVSIGGGENPVTIYLGRSRRPSTSLTLDEITGNAILFMLGGYDTTSNALTFASYCLATNPECQEKLIQEIDSKLEKESPDYDNIQNLEYLDHVLSETLRLYPPGAKANRKADKDLVINGYKVPKNSEIAFPIYAIHRDPEYWNEPEKFDPERFTLENKAKRHPYTYLPFGHGPRRCIGIRLAQLKTKYALVYILQHYRFKTCKETEIPVQISKAALIKPQNGMTLKLEAR